ncbi:MAG TPA: transcription antitermination protein NusB, partial [Rhodanobacter sp.]
EVDPIERAALRLAAYELKHRPDVPYRVVINEAIEVTKRFGADHGHSYVNGVLDKLAGELRSAEKRG